MEFIHDDFLLHSKMARKLYHDYAADQPILDYHSHLPAADIAADHRFHDLWEIWVQGDHYKWRLMRANGVAENYCTGAAPPREKFLAWARTVPLTLRNPLYLWTHLELKRYFGIAETLNENTASLVWDRANSALQSGDLSTQGILRKFAVRVVCTSDDPCDDLSSHRALNASATEFRMYPTFRPDHALRIGVPGTWNAWVNRLQAASKKEVSSLNDFLEALRQRHDFFHAHGGRLSDHGLARCHSTPCVDRDAALIFDKVRADEVPTDTEQEQFASFLMLFSDAWTPKRAGRSNFTWERSAMSIQGGRGKLALTPATTVSAIGNRPLLSAHIWTCWRGNTPCPRLSSITSTRRIITFSPLPWAIFRMAQSRGRCSSAARGGFSTRRKGSNGN